MPPIPEALPVIDHGPLEALWAPGDTFILHELVGLFAEDAGLHVERIGRALGGGDAMGVARAAHALKGSSANLGLLRLAWLASRLELAARQGELLHSPAEALAPELSRAVAALRERWP